MALKERLPRAMVCAALAAFCTLTSAAAQWSPTRTGTPSSTASRAAIPAVASDPVGDSLGNAVHDISQFSATSDGVSLTLQLTFVGSVSLPGSGQPNEIFGFIDLDTDQNGATGSGANVAFNCPAPPFLGVDYFVSLFGSGNVVDANTMASLGMPTVMANGNTLSVQIPLALLGGDDGLVNTAAVIGDAVGPNDCAPDDAFLTNNPGVPTMGEAALLILVSLLLSGGAIVVQRRSRPA